MNSVANMRFPFIYTCLFFLSACYQNESSIENSLVYCTEHSTTSLNPQISHDTASLDATTHQLYNRLVKIDPISKRFIPDLATHWRVNDAKTSYTFNLRKDVQFHQTSYFTPLRAFNADDVVFSFKRMLSKEHPYHEVNQEVDSYYFNHPFSNLIADVIKIDDHTVKITLNKSDETLLANLAAHYSVILSKQYADQLLSEGQPKKLDYYPIGTGPYAFKNQTNAGITRYVAHANYWQGKPAIEQLIYDVTVNSTKRYAKLLSGECDVITYPAPSQIKKISENSNISLSSQPTSNIALLAFNSQRAPFNDRLFRQAVSMGIDDKTIVDAVFYETATPTTSLIVAHSWAHNSRLKGFQYSAEKAAANLAKLSYHPQSPLEILIPQRHSIFYPNFAKAAQLIQSNLAAIGLHSAIISLNDAELHHRLSTGNYDAYLTGMKSYINDPDSLLRPLFSCDVLPTEGNSARWCDKQFDALMKSSRSEPNFIQRIKNYYQLQVMIENESPYFPIAQLLRFDAFNKNISGIIVDPLTGINFQYTTKIKAN